MVVTHELGFNKCIIHTCIKNIIYVYLYLMGFCNFMFPLLAFDGGKSSTTFHREVFSHMYLPLFVCPSLLLSSLKREAERPSLPKITNYCNLLTTADDTHTQKRTNYTRISGSHLNSSLS